jgi:hypothetical protein
VGAVFGAKPTVSADYRFIFLFIPNDSAYDAGFNALAAASTFGFIEYGASSYSFF